MIIHFHVRDTALPGVLLIACGAKPTPKAQASGALMRGTRVPAAVTCKRCLTKIHGR